MHMYTHIYIYIYIKHMGVLIYYYELIRLHYGKERFICTHNKGE